MVNEDIKPKQEPNPVLNQTDPDKTIQSFNFNSLPNPFDFQNQNHIMMIMKGIQMVRKGLSLLQKSPKPDPEKPIPQRDLLIKDFNTLFQDNNIQNVQLGFYNAAKNELFQVHPLAENEAENNFDNSFMFQNHNSNAFNFNPFMSPCVPNLHNYQGFGINPSMNMSMSPNFTPIINPRFFGSSNFSTPSPGFTNFFRGFERPGFNLGQNLLGEENGRMDLKIKKENN